MQKIKITSRSGKIGKSVNTRTEMHGQDEVPGQDIGVTGIILGDEELCAITDESTAPTGLFKKQDGNWVPRIFAADPITLSHKFTNATVKMSGGVPATTYQNAKIKNIVLEPLTGGMTSMSCTIQVNPTNGDPSAQQLINAKINISIRAELEEEKPDDEPELPLEHNDQGTDEGEADED